MSNNFLFADVRLLDALGLEPYNVEVCRILRDYKIEVKTTMLIKVVHRIFIEQAGLVVYLVLYIYLQDFWNIKEPIKRKMAFEIYDYLQFVSNILTYPGK